MIPTILCAGLNGTAPKWSAAFARGCGASWALYAGRDVVGDAGLACFGHPSLEPLLFDLKRRGVPFYYGDHAYFGRGRFYRCTKNAWQHAGLEGDVDRARFASFGIPVRDWRSRGSHIVIAPNSQPFLERHGAPGWVEQTMAELRRLTDRPLRLRWKKDAELRPLSDDLVGAWALVTFTSNAAVEAILAGIPAICTAPCAGASMGGTSLQAIEAPLMPEGRLEWAQRLANNQWTLEEMAAGQAWRAMGAA